MMINLSRLVYFLVALVDFLVALVVITGLWAVILWSIGALVMP